MRKHDVRKWLHAILDLLPLVVIPVFMVYSHRHTIDSYSVTAPKYEKVQVQQDVLNGLPTSDLDNIYIDGDVDYYNNSIRCVEEGTVQFNIDLSSVLGDSILFRFYYMAHVDCFFDYSITDINYEYLVDDTFDISSSDDFLIGNIYLSNEIANSNYNLLSINFSHEQTFYLKNVQLFNLTDMFGSGIEPTIEQFNAYFPNDYYAHDDYASALVNIGTVTYDKTDIGNQMFYSLYNTVEQQFNFTKVFNFGDLYNFLNLNLFGGNAPLSIFVIYNIIIYEFLMDMLFIIYSVFMFIIDFIENLFENVFSRAKRGGR